MNATCTKLCSKAVQMSSLFRCFSMVHLPHLVSVTLSALNISSRFYSVRDRDTSEHQIENFMPWSISHNDISTTAVIFSGLSVNRVLLYIVGYFEFVRYLKKCGLKYKLYKKYNYIMSIWSFLVRLVVSWKTDFLERPFFCKIKFNAIGSLAILFIVLSFNRV